MKKSSVFPSHFKAIVPATVKPRKTPVQARSSETVRAIGEATIQVLLETGASRLTTTRVAHRAGVSVGTLYQYFPNKNALLHAVLREHLVHICEAVEEVCEASRGASIETMARAVVMAFIEAKLRNVQESLALYSAADIADAKPILVSVRRRSTKAITTMLRSAPGVRFDDLETTAMVFYIAMAGIMRAVLEDGASKSLVGATRRQLVTLAIGHLAGACRPVDATGLRS
jgi:AcrR family transcriptional regulator